MLNILIVMIVDVDLVFSIWMSLKIYQVNNISPLKYVSLENQKTAISSLTFNPSPTQAPCVLQRREMCPHLNHYGVHCVNCQCQPNQLLQSPFFIVSLCNLQIRILVLLKLQNQLRVYHMVYKLFCSNVSQGFHRLPFTAEITSYMQFAHLILFVHLHCTHKLFVHPHCVHNTNNNVSSSVAVS